MRFVYLWATLEHGRIRSENYNSLIWINGLDNNNQEREKEKYARSVSRNNSCHASRINVSSSRSSVSIGTKYVFICGKCVGQKQLWGCPWNKKSWETEPVKAICLSFRMLFLTVHLFIISYFVSDSNELLSGSYNRRNDIHQEAFLSLFEAAHVQNWWI